MDCLQEESEEADSAAVRREFASFMREMNEEMERLSTEQRIYMVVKAYMYSGRAGEALSTRFCEWLTDCHNAEAKDRALERVLNEMMNEDSILASQSDILN